MTLTQNERIQITVKNVTEQKKFASHIMSPPSPPSSSSSSIHSHHNCHLNIQMNFVPNVSLEFENRRDTKSP